jgi:hypothetical protein
MEEGGSMSDRKKKNESSGTATLEEVFSSRDFARSQRGAAGGAGGLAVAGTRQVLFSAESGSALSSGSEEGANDQGLEDVLLSPQFGKPLRLVPPLEPAGATPAAARVVVPFPTMAPGDNRYRAIAAVSGIAAAALVVAGVSTGTGQARPGGDIAALGQHPAAQRGGLGSLGRVSTGTPAPGAGTPNAALASAIGSSPPASHVLNATPRSTNTPSAVFAVSGSPGTAATAVPSPGAPGGEPTGSGGGTGVGTGSPAPSPPAGTDPVAPVVTALGSSVTGVGTSVTSAAGQVGSAMPATATAAAVVGAGGATVSQLGQTLSSTTA